MTKVAVDGKEYCVETLLFTIQRLKKDVIVGGKALNKLGQIELLVEREDLRAASHGELSSFEKSVLEVLDND